MGAIVQIRKGRAQIKESARREVFLLALWTGLVHLGSDVNKCIVIGEEVGTVQAQIGFDEHPDIVQHGVGILRIIWLGLKERRRRRWGDIGWLGFQHLCADLLACCGLGLFFLGCWYRRWSRRHLTVVVIICCRCYRWILHGFQCLCHVFVNICRLGNLFGLRQWSWRYLAVVIIIRCSCYRWLLLGFFQCRHVHIFVNICRLFNLFGEKVTVLLWRFAGHLWLARCGSFPTLCLEGIGDRRRM